VVQLAICGLLVGAVFGLRFKVLVLLPVTIVGAVWVGLGSLVWGLPAVTSLIAVTVFSLALQGGYLFGSALRFTLAASRQARAPQAKPQGVPPALKSFF